MYRQLLLFTGLLLNFIAYAQDGYSKKQLLEIITNPVNDTTLLNAFNELIWPIYSYDKPDSSIYYGEKAVALAKRINDIKRLSIAHRRLGITYTNRGDIKTSLQHQQTSYDLSEKINYKKGMQLALNNMGVAYLNNEILNKALSYFLRSLKLAEETKNYSLAASLYYNCAIIYRRTNDHLKSKEFLFKAIGFSKPNKDSTMLLLCYSGLSTTYRNLQKIDSAFYYLKLAKKHLTEQSTGSSKFGYYLNEGLLYSEYGDHVKALELFIYTKKFASVTSDEITVLINIAEEYTKLNNSEKALTYFYLAYDLSYKTKTYNNLSYLSFAIAKIYESKNKNKKFSEFIHLHLNFKDSNEKYIKIQQIQQQQLEFDFERRQVADSLRFEHLEKLKDKELEVASEKLNKERIFGVMLLIMLAGIISFALFTFNRLKITRQQKLIIEKQKHLVEIKNQEMLDSINYAKRLQNAILPQLSDIKKELSLDILYLPKDIIGGDFYFFEKFNGYTFFAVCDCTGHGIPGALMSVVCYNSLHKAIKEFNLTEPGLILNKTRNLIVESLNAKNQNIRDGMDCSLIAIENKTKKVKWAGANNHIWLLENNELIELKADKQPVAFYENEKEFTDKLIPLKSGSVIYMLTDGYGDQFGGPRGKKYKNKTLKDFILSIRSNDETNQIKLLQQNILNWKKDLDQVDDITVAVMRF